MAHPNNGSTKQSPSFDRSLHGAPEHFAGPQTIYRLRRLSLTILLAMSTFFACFSVITTTSGEGLESLAFFLLCAKKKQNKEPSTKINQQERRGRRLRYAVGIPMSPPPEKRLAAHSANNNSYTWYILGRGCSLGREVNACKTTAKTNRHKIEFHQFWFTG